MEVRPACAVRTLVLNVAAPTPRVGRTALFTAALNSLSLHHDVANVTTKEIPMEVPAMRIPFAASYVSPSMLPNLAMFLTWSYEKVPLRTISFARAGSDTPGT